MKCVLCILSYIRGCYKVSCTTGMPKKLQRVQIDYSVRMMLCKTLDGVFCYLAHFPFFRDGWPSSTSSTLSIRFLLLQVSFVRFHNFWNGFNETISIHWDSVYIDVYSNQLYARLQGSFACESYQPPKESRRSHVIALASRRVGEAFLGTRQRGIPSRRACIVVFLVVFQKHK